MSAPAVAPTPAPALRPPITYVALGASDTAGIGVERPERDGWAAILSQRLPQPARLVNLGLPGVKLAEAIEVQLPPAIEARPDLITIWLVVNDVLGGVSRDSYRADLARLLDSLRSSTRAHIAVGNVPDAAEGTNYLGLPSSQRRRIAGEWNRTIEEVVNAHDAILVDLFRLWPVPQHPEYIGPDRLHPTAAGYRALAETFHHVLREQRIF